MVVWGHVPRYQGVHDCMRTCMCHTVKVSVIWGHMPCCQGVHGHVGTCAMASRCPWLYVDMCVPHHRGVPGHMGHMPCHQVSKVVWGHVPCCRGVHGGMRACVCHTIKVSVVIWEHVPCRRGLYGDMSHTIEMSMVVWGHACATPSRCPWSYGDTCHAIRCL